MQNNNPLSIRRESPWLAPLSGFSDLPFRLLCRELGASVTCTEMISAKGLLFNSPGTKEIIETVPEDKPLVAQVFGSDPDIVARGVEELMDAGFEYFDLNAGCPVPKVCRGGSGAALLKTPDILLNMAAKMVKVAGEGRVGVKIRLGWSAADAVAFDIGERLEALGVAWITLHPRYAVQGFSGKADNETYHRMRGTVGIPIIGSGDFFDAAHALRVLDDTGIDGIMFARGALRDPAIFSKYRELLRGGQPLPPTPSEIRRLIERHFELSMIYGNEKKALLKMRTIMPRYLKGIEGAHELRKKMTQCLSWECFKEVLESLH